MRTGHNYSPDMIHDALGRVAGWVRGRFPRLAGWVLARLDRADPLGLPLTLAVGAAVIAGWLFGGLTQDVLGHDDSVLADPRITSLVVARRVGWLTSSMELLTWLGSTVVVVPAAILIGGSLFVRRRDWRPLAMLTAAVAGAIALYDMFKPAVGRARPPSSIWIGHYGGGAFPSGHATAAVAFYGMLALILSRGARPGTKAVVWFGATFVALIVGASRVYLGAHWLTDVIGGYALGTTWLAVLSAIALAWGSYLPSGRDEQGKGEPRWAGRSPPRREAA